jgi:hypothetical protein
MYNKALYNNGIHISAPILAAVELTAFMVWLPV